MPRAGKVKEREEFRVTANGYRLFSGGEENTKLDYGFGYTTL